MKRIAIMAVAGVAYSCVLVQCLGCQAEPPAVPASFATPDHSPLYRIVQEHPLPSGGFSRVIVVNQKMRTGKELRELGNILRNDTAAEPNAFVFIYDNEEAADLRQAALDGQLSEKDLRRHDKHMVGIYSRNANTGKHCLDYGLAGINGPVEHLDY